MILMLTMLGGRGIVNSPRGKVAAEETSSAGRPPFTSGGGKNFSTGEKAKGGREEHFPPYNSGRRFNTTLVRRKEREDRKLSLGTEKVVVPKLSSGTGRSTESVVPRPSGEGADLFCGQSLSSSEYHGMGVPPRGDGPT